MIERYCAFLSSQLHLNAFRAYMIDSKGINQCIPGEIHILKAPNGKLCIDTKDINFLLENSYSILFSPNEDKKKSAFKTAVMFLKESIMQISAYHKMNKSNIREKKGVLLVFVYLESKLTPLFLWQIQKQYPLLEIRVVILEEGMGNYIRTGDDWIQKDISKINGILKKKVYWCFASYKREYSQKMIEKLREKSRLMEFRFFHKEGDILVQNHNVCNAFAEAFRQQGEGIGVEKDFYKNAVVINSQPFFEELGVDDDIVCYKQLIDICKKYDLKVILKPHPREKKIERYQGLDLIIDINKEVSQESSFAVADEKPLIVIGFFSTTLITSHILWNIEAVTVGKLMEGQGWGTFRGDVDEFVSVFQNQLKIPHDMSELETIIGSAKIVN